MSKRNGNDHDSASSASVAASGHTPTASAGAAGDSATTAKPSRFTIRSAGESGPVPTVAGVVFDKHGVGKCDVPASAYHCVLMGFEVTDANNDNKPYTGAPPADRPANG